jgi:hypothetical protein
MFGAVVAGLSRGLKFKGSFGCPGTIDAELRRSTSEPIRGTDRYLGSRLVSRLANLLDWRLLRYN